MDRQSTPADRRQSELKSSQNRVKVALRRCRAILGDSGASGDAPETPRDSPGELPGRPRSVSGRSPGAPGRSRNAPGRSADASHSVLCAFLFDVHARTRCRIASRTIFDDFRVACGTPDRRFVCIFTSRNACRVFLWKACQTFNV